MIIWLGAWQLVGWPEAEAQPVAERFYLIHKQEAERERAAGNGVGF